MFKFKWFAVVAALALLVLASGCASQAGSEPSTPVEGAGVTSETPQTPALAESPLAIPSTESPAVAESPVATPEIEATRAVTSTGATTEAGEGAGMEPPEQSEAVQGWPVLWDPEIGFEVRYPPAWLVSEVDVTEKDAPVTRVYGLQPAEWDEEWPPILVEVSEGGEEDFRRIYLEPVESEERNIGPLVYTYETAGEEGSLEHFAVFQDTENPDLRVVVRDVLTGFPERAAAHGDLAPLIQQVIESFRWRK